jgi:hypothetical protein
LQPPVSQLPIIDGKYQLIRQLGEGGMGAVYEARHLGTARRVAVKVIAGEALSKNVDIVSRFQREAMATGAIESQYIAHVVDTGVDRTSGSPYMVMDLLVGEDVEHAIRRLGPLPPDLALRIVAQACLGLQKAHESNVVHRDIKPANLYLTRRDGGEVVLKILDFGIAKMKVGSIASSEGKNLTRTGAMLGSPLYMSPEQAFGKKTLDHRTDIWSLGVVLYEMLSGATPHGDAETVGELIVRICQQTPRVVQELAPWVPPEIATIVHRALALDPNARFATASEFYAAIRARLPQGHALDESMFVPLAQQARAVAAPRVVLLSEAGATLPVASGTSPSTAPPQRVTARTTAGFGKTGDAPAGLPKRGGALVWVAAGTIGIAALTGGAFTLLHHSRGTPGTGPSATITPEASASAGTVATPFPGTTPSAAPGTPTSPPSSSAAPTVATSATQRAPAAAQPRPPPGPRKVQAPQGAPTPAAIDPASIR